MHIAFRVDASLVMGTGHIVRCLTLAQELIIAGKRRPLDLLQSVKTCWLPFANLRDLDGVEKFFLNINTPEDYDEATRKGAVPQN